MRRHWKVAIVGFSFASLLVVWYASRYVEQYLSSTVVFHQPSLNPESVTGERDMNADPMLLRELLMRHTRIQKLIKEHGVHASIVEAEGMNAAVDEVRRRATFEPVGKSTFRISYRGDSAENAPK